MWSVPAEQTCTWFKRRCVCLMHRPSMAWAGKMLLDALKGRNRLPGESVLLSGIGNALVGTHGSLIQVSLRSQHASLGAGHATGCFTCHLWPPASRWIANHHTQENPKWDFCLALTTCQPPDWISLPIALFSQRAPKLGSKIP